MSQANPLWGAPRIHGELLKLGIAVAQSTVARYLPRLRKPPSQTWRTFLENHLKSLVSVDFFTVPTIRFEVLYVFLVLAHDRRRILHFNVTAHPTAEWTAQQLRDASAWKTVLATPLPVLGAPSQPRPVISPSVPGCLASAWREESIHLSWLGRGHQALLPRPQWHHGVRRTVGRCWRRDR